MSVTNTLATRCPEIAREWHLNNNGTLTPRDVAAGSTRKVWWQCAANPLHEWRASLVSRTHNSNGCPYCSLAPRSLQEILLAFEIRHFIAFDMDNHKVLLSGRVIDCDMVIPTLRLIIEFDGAYWHRHKQQSDKRKAELLRAANWRVIRVREHPLKALHADDVEVPLLAPKLAADAVLQRVEQVCRIGLQLDAYLRRDQLVAEKAARRYATELLARRTAVEGQPELHPKA